MDGDNQAPCLEPTRIAVLRGRGHAELERLSVRRLRREPLRYTPLTVVSGCSKMALSSDGVTRWWCIGFCAAVARPELR